MTAITAITAQNTVGVEAVQAISPRIVVAQVRAVAEDIGVDAVKIGMLGTVETVEAVVEALGYVGEAPVVIDPVMVAESGAVLLDEEARRALAEKLLPLAAVVTPNIPEARALTGLGEEAPQAELARALVGMGARAAVVTGGHSEAVIDVFYDGDEVVEIPGERHPDGAAHGSGCTHSRRREGRARSPLKPCVTACATSAPGPAPWTSLASVEHFRACECSKAAIAAVAPSVDLAP